MTQLQDSDPPGFESTNQYKSEFKTGGLSQKELILLWLLSAVCFLIVLSHFQSYRGTIGRFGDNGNYISAAHAIERWDLGSSDTKQGWGLSYLIAVLSIFHLPDQVALLCISITASLGSVLLGRNLWGPWIAAFFAILNFPWIQTSFLGGSEPLFVFLLFGSFWFSRKERWIAASALAALATLTRPVGIFALFALGLSLLLRKDYRRLLNCTLVAALIGFIYLLPFWIFLHDPLYQFHRYKHEDWQSGHLVTWPFHTIAVSYLYYTGPWTNVVLTGGWIALAAIGLFRMGWTLYRDGLPEHSNEQIFAISYLIFLFCYNSLEWARWDFHRFVIPAVPLILLAFDRWLPKSRYVLYPICAVSSILAACSAIGIQKVLSSLR